MTINDLPATFVQNVNQVSGDAGRDWLQNLPTLLQDIADEWGLTFGEPFPLSFHYVTRATRVDGLPVVLKVGLPTPARAWEVEATRLLKGAGMVPLLAHDNERGATLLEHIRPGTMLKALALVDDAQSTAIAAEVVSRLRLPVPADCTLPTVQDWGRAFGQHRARFGGGGPIPAPLFDRADHLFHELAASQDAPVVLHGDLHHENILQGGAGWVVIDPQGVVGEPAYEVGALLRNPTPELFTWPDIAQIHSRRTDQLSERLGFHRERVHGWAFAQAVLSAVWSYEDGDGSEMVAFAQAVAT